MIGTLSHVGGFEVQIEGKMFLSQTAYLCSLFPLCTPCVDFYVFTRFLSFRIAIVELDVKSCATLSAVILVVIFTSRELGQV